MALGWKLDIGINIFAAPIWQMRSFLSTPKILSFLPSNLISPGNSEKQQFNEFMRCCISLPCKAITCMNKYLRNSAERDCRTLLLG